MLFGEDAVAEQHDGRRNRQLAVELDRERVHRDGADRATPLARDANGRPRQIAAKAVRVAHGHEADPGVAFGDEPATVASALACVQELHLREMALPRERRLEFGRHIERRVET